MKIDRLFAIVLLMLHRKKVTAVELSERFEVSVRTIYRDIDTIGAAGIPILSHQGQGGGFSVMDNYRLEKQLLTPEEIMTMVSVLKGVGEALGDRRVLHSSRKMESLVPSDATCRFEEELRIELSPWGYRGEQDALLETLRKTTLQRKLIRFSYRNSAGETIERIAEPMTLLFKGSAWYLFAYCRTRSDCRLFRLSRMRDVFVTGEAFERRPNGYEAYGAQSERSEGETAELLLRFFPRVQYLVEDWFSKDQIAAQSDGTLLVHAPIPTGEWLFGWLLSFGEHVEVLEPQSIREAMKERLAASHKRYER
jgi:predicted DNA-binding transcriptional regulator YafY